MAEQPSVELARLREIGWTEWDPIGLLGSGAPPDEYDRYLLQAVSRLRRGEPVVEVAGFLLAIGREAMGLDEPTDDTRSAAERTAMLIKEYLDSLPPGPLRVR